MTDSNPPDPHSGAHLTGDEVNVGGDVAGRDKIVSTTTTTTTTHTTTNVEGGPVARYAVVGVVVIALAAIITLALWIPRPPVVPPTASATLSPTPEPSATPAAVASATDTPPPPASPTVPTATPTTAPPSPTPEPSLTPTATFTQPPTETATPTLPAGVTPTPTSALPVYDAFDDRCVNAARWAMQAVPSSAALRGSADQATPEASATPTPEPPVCLPVEDQFFTEGRDGRLTVFVGLEAAGSHTLAQAPAGCFREAEVVLALDQAELFAPEREIYLTVGASLRRRTGEAVLEVRLRANNYTSRAETDLRPRLTVPEGTFDLDPVPYTLGRPVTIALRALEVGETPAGSTGAANKMLALFVDGQRLVTSFSIIADPCDLTIGYHAEAGSSLLGYFEEVRLVPAP
jgi:hypothetical protein